MPIGRAERLALLGVLHALVDAALGDAGGDGGDGDAALVQDRQEVGVAAAALAEQVLLRDADVGEGERVRVGGVPADLVVRRLGGEAGRRHGHQDRGDLLLAAAHRAGDGGGRDQRRDARARVRDERLGPVDHPLAAVEHGGGAGAAGVAARTGLGEAEGAERAARDEVGQELLLLRVGAEAEDRHGAERDAGLQRHRDRLVDLGELLQGEAQGEVVAAHAADLLGERQAEQPHLGHPLHDLVGERLVLVVLVGDGRDDLAGELPHGLDEAGLLLGEPGVEH